MKPISKLREGTQIVGAGNLNYKVGTMAKDEVGQLSRAFDRMTIQLKDSFTGLKKEIAERKRAEEALRVANAYNRSLIEASLDPTCDDRFGWKDHRCECCYGEGYRPFP